MSLNIEISKDGYKILKVDTNDKKQYLGSKYNQKREIEKFINSFGEFTEKDSYIILGLSFAEHVKELLKVTYRNSHILIIELDEKLNDYCRNDVGINSIIKDPRVTVTKEDNEIKEFFEKYVDISNVKQLKVKAYCNYDKIYNQDLQKIYEIIKVQTLKIVLNRNTGILASEISFDNMLNNLKYMAKSTLVNKLKDKYKNKGAIIVSAGPSLSKNIDILKNINNRLILSGGRTLRPLMDKNITPSLTGIMDPGEVSYKLVEDYIERMDCPLIFNDEINSKILKHHNKNNFFTSQNEFLKNIWKEEIKSLYAGGSVAHMLTTLAIYMGCNQIVFIGQDLAYTGERGHDVSAGNKWHELTFNDYKNSRDIYVKDIYGNPVRTSLTLNDYRISMEEIIDKHPDIEFINATEGGANINGAKNMTLEDVLKNCNDDNIVPVEKFLVDENKTNEIIKELQDSLNTFNKYDMLCKRGLLIVEDYRTGYYTKNIKLIRKSEETLNKIDSEIRKNLKSLNIINTALTKAIYTVESNDDFTVLLSDNKDIVFDKNVNKSEALYSGIKGVISNCYKKIENTIIELGEVNNEGKI